MNKGEIEKQILDFIRNEAQRIEYGQLTIKLKVHKKKITNVQAEHVRNSQNINYDNVGKNG